MEGYILLLVILFLMTVGVVWFTYTVVTQDKHKEKETKKEENHS